MLVYFYFRLERKKERKERCDGIFCYRALLTQKIGTQIKRNIQKFRKILNSRKLTN